MRTTISLKYFVVDCLWKAPFDSNSPQTPSSLIYLKFCKFQDLSHCFNPKLDQLGWKKVLKFTLIFDVFNEVEIS